jgi:small acid-soluble spore protein (thioredoxin-like protein)
MLRKGVRQMAKPDDRSDNVEKLQSMIDNTMENIRESRDYLKAHAGEISAEQKAEMEAKSKRREESIQGFRAEIKDEGTDQ